jgi:hypothetical protein
VAESASRIGEQRIDGPAKLRNRRVELIDAFEGGKVGLDGLDTRSGAAKHGRRLLDLRLIGRDDEIETVIGAAFCQLEADAGGSACD